MKISNNVVVVPFPEPPVKLEPLLERTPTPMEPLLAAQPELKQEPLPPDVFVPAIPPLPEGWAVPEFCLPPAAPRQPVEDLQRLEMAEVGAMITFAFTLGILTGGVAGVLIVRSML